MQEVNVYKLTVLYVELMLKNWKTCVNPAKCVNPVQVNECFSVL